MRLPHVGQPYRCTTHEQEPHSLSRLKIGLKLWVTKKVIVCRLSYYMSVLKKIYTLRKNFISDIVRLYKKRLHVTVRPGPFKKKEEKKRKYNGLTGTQKFLGRPNFLLPFKTEILTLEIVSCKLPLLKRPAIFSIQIFCLRDVFYVKVDHRSCRRNFCSCEKKAWKKF